MKITLLSHRLEWGEQAMLAHLVNRGVTVNTLSLDEALDAPSRAHDVILNRVYASVANQDDRLLKKALQVLHSLEAHGKKCINSAASSEADYDKLLQFNRMREAGVDTPLSLSIDSLKDWQQQQAAIEQLAFPLVIKRRAGGRAKQIFRVHDTAALEHQLHQLLTDDQSRNYHSGYLLQPFLESTATHDARIAIINDKFAYSYGRSLVASQQGEPAWIGSNELGSAVVDYQADAQAIELARNASRAVGSCINEVDLLFTKDGPVVIENNLTPNFSASKQAYLETLCDKLLESVDNGC